MFLDIALIILTPIIQEIPRDSKYFLVTNSSDAAGPGAKVRRKGVQVPPAFRRRSWRREGRGNLETDDDFEGFLMGYTLVMH